MIEPIIFITKQALYEMVNEVLRFPEIETAWGLYGLIFPNETTLVTGILKASASDIVRKYATTTLGGNRQAEAVRWLSSNHKILKKMNVSPDEARFAFLFKGHSHHVLGVDSYSSQDHASIFEAVEKDGLEIAIGPLATLETKGPDVNYLASWRGTMVIDQSQRVWLRFYYLSRSMLENRVRRARLIDPIVVDAVDVPVVPPLGWQFTREDDYLEQLRHIKNYGCQVQVILREIRNGPPFEVQFLVSKPNWLGMLSIVTDWDFPKTAPTFQVLNPTKGSSEAGDYEGAKYLLEEPLWSPEFDLIEVVFRLEARGEL
ncbi:hypothetical protein A3H19_03020 [Candidatus Woesebacteria bacterium RIFCSPLOWO2_12_FULL_39_9]|nr:MAG: hypothetical protein A3H19_03020 [Candidatus Woesebacteria bacterium RIFCSPLOWO2_12_FULL_39_9]